MLNAVVRAAKGQAKTTAELRKLIIIPSIEGKKEDEGYRYFPDMDLSVQGQDANGAWKAARHIARKLGFQLAVTFVWREKEKAAFPGVIGKLVVEAAR